jgi:hypothetical protein
VEIISNDQNLGSGYSRNKALELIENGIVAIIDSDDTWDADYGQKMMSLWQGAPARTGAIGMLLRPVGNLDKSGYIRQNSRMHKQGSSLISGLSLAWHNPFYASATSFDATVLKEIGGWGPKPHAYSEDYSLLARIFDYGYTLYLDPIECGSYTVSLTQKSANVRLQLTAEIAVIDFIVNSGRFETYRLLWFRVAVIKFGVWCRSIIRLLYYNQREIPQLAILGESRILVLLDWGISRAVSTTLLLVPFKIIRRIRHLS